jgi:DNA-binding transcriptional LysR family regulator
MAAVDFPNLRHLRTFEAVARLESLGRAATELNRTQPGITQTIAKLEADFAVALMERRYSGTYLTECGRVLLARTIRLLSHLSMALSEPSLVAAAAEPARAQSMIGKVTTSHIRCLIAFSEGNSVGAAAELAGISNSSLVRKIRELEQIIGRRLTRNTAQGGSLHPHGVELARRLKLAATEIEFAREEIAALSGVVQTRIKIGAMPHCAILVLVGAIDEFLRRQPGAHVTLEQKPYDTLLDDLRAGKIDFLFGVLRKPEWARDVEELPLFSNPYAIVVGRHHPHASDPSPWRIWSNTTGFCRSRGRRGEKRSSRSSRAMALRLPRGSRRASWRSWSP